MARGSFVSFEGIDGCGKSTHIRRLAEALEAEGLEVVLVRDPGTTRLSEAIRALLLDPANTDMAKECELLLYEAARAQLVAEIIEPALARGAWVLSDRFLDSTTAYQGGGRAISDRFITEANALGSLGLTPDLTLVFDLDVEEAARRRCADPDRIEREGDDFARSVREAYLALAASEAPRVRVIDASGTKGQTFALVRDAIEAYRAEPSHG